MLEEGTKIAESVGRSSDESHILERLGRIGLAAAGAAYVFGVLIVNVHLGRLGFPPPDFLQARYILVGALWLALIGVAVATTAWAWSVFESRWRQRLLRHRVYGTGLALCIAILAGALPLIVTYGNLRVPLPNLWPAILLMFAVSGEAWMDWTTLRGWVRCLDDLPAFSIRYALFQFAWALLSWYVLTWVYAAVAYPALPPAIGGGKASAVVLLPAAGKSDVMRRLQFPERPDGLFGPIQLEAEDGESYFLVYRAGHKAVPVRLAKTSCDGVLHEVH